MQQTFINNNYSKHNSTDNHPDRNKKYKEKLTDSIVTRVILIMNKMKRLLKYNLLHSLSDI